MQALAEAAAPPQVGARRAALDIATQVIGRVGNLALGVVVTLILARALGEDSFGEWATIFAVTQIATNVGELGLNQVAVARAASDPQRAERWLGALLSLRLLIALPTTLLALLGIALIAPNSTVALAGALIALTILANAPSAANAAFQLRVRNDLTIAVITLGSIVWAAGAIAVAAISGAIAAFAAAFLVTALVTTAATLVLARRLGPVRPLIDRELWRALLRVGLAVGAAGIFVTLYVKLDQILVFELAGSAAAGLYGAAYRVLEQIQFIPSAVMTTLFPLIAAAHPHDLQRVRRLLQSAAEYLTMASLPALAFTIVASRQIVALLFGGSFAGAAPALPILMGAFVSISFGYLAGNMVLILELQRRFLRYAALGLLVNAVLNVALIPLYGFLAAAWITLATEVLVMTLTMREVLIGLAMTPRVGRLLRIALAATGMGLVTWLARLAGAPLGALVLVAVLSYPPLLFGLRALSVAQLQGLLRREPL